jgi:hypothetical protein
MPQGEVAIITPDRVLRNVDRIDGSAKVRCRSARAGARTDFNAFRCATIGCRNGWCGTVGKALAVRVKQEDAREYIVPAHLFDGHQMPVEDLLEAVPSHELGRKLSVPIL